MLKLKKLSEMYGMKVFTEMGDYFGDIEEAMMIKHSIISWRIRASASSKLGKQLENASGIVIPHKLIKDIGDVVLIANIAIPKSAPTPEENKKAEEM